MLGVIRDRAHILVAARKGDTAEFFGVSNRTVLPHLIPNRIGIGDPDRIEVVEIVVQIELRCVGTHWSTAPQFLERARDSWLLQAKPCLPSPLARVRAAARAR